MRLLKLFKREKKQQMVESEKIEIVKNLGGMQIVVKSAAKASECLEAHWIIRQDASINETNKPIEGYIYIVLMEQNPCFNTVGRNDAFAHTYDQKQALMQLIKDLWKANAEPRLIRYDLIKPCKVGEPNPRIDLEYLLKDVSIQ